MDWRVQLHKIFGDRPIVVYITDVGLGETLRLGLVASLQCLLLLCFIVDEVIDAGPTAKKSKLDLHDVAKNDESPVSRQGNRNLRIYMRCPR